MMRDSQRGWEGGGVGVECAKTLFKPSPTLRLQSKCKQRNRRENLHDSTSVKQLPWGMFRLLLKGGWPLNTGLS